MPLSQCPWMAATCPHYREPCRDPESKHCFYVKQTTSAMHLNLVQFQALVRQGGHAGLNTREVYADVQRFVDDSLKR